MIEFRIVRDLCAKRTSLLGYFSLKVRDSRFLTPCFGGGSLEQKDYELAMATLNMIRGEYQLQVRS